MLKENDYKSIFKDIQGCRKNLLVSREGSGKSRFTEFLVSRLQKVIFLSATNKQAEEKHISFLKLGFKSQLVKSRSAKLKELGIEPVLKRKISPFECSSIDEEATLELLDKQFGARAYKIWTSCKNDEFDIDSDIQIICATFAQKWQISSFSSDSYIVIFDDPERSQVSDYLLISDEFINKNSISNTEITTSEVMPGIIRQFLRRPNELTLDNGVKLPILFTTTEELTSNLIIKNLGANMIDYRENKLEGNIFLFGTKLTRKKYDFMIPYFSKYLESKNLPNILIGDGLIINEFNHVNSKGNNQLMNVSTIIEISWPATERTFDLKLEFPDKTQRELEVMLLTDQLHQALGRNQGYRNRGKSAYVLCDYQYVDKVSEKLSYKHTLLKTREERMSIEIEDEIYWYIHKFLTRPINFMFDTDGKKQSIIYKMIDKMDYLPEQIIELMVKMDDLNKDENNSLIINTITKLLPKINDGALIKHIVKKNSKLIELISKKCTL